MGWYKETETPETFMQGLKIGDAACFFRDGDKYLPDEGWQCIDVLVKIVGADYPSIITDKGRFHYSRFKHKIVAAGGQLSMF